MTSRCSPRLHPRIHSSEEGAAGIHPRRSPRLHPQIQASETGAGVTFRRSPVLHPQIHANEDGLRTSHRIRRLCGKSPVESASLPDDDDMLWEILLRLPPQPSSLPRSSAVCKRWRRLVTDPNFHRQFYAHHRKPPLLGVFKHGNQGIVFKPILDPPDRVSPDRFDLGCYSGLDDCSLLHCRHGLVLVRDWAREEVVVCDPITGEQRRVAIPPEFKTHFFIGAVLCAAGDQGHMHGGCHSRHFKVVLMSMHRRRCIACVYSSEIGIWGNIISTTESSYNITYKSAVLVGNCLYWMSDDMIQFDLDENNLTGIKGPPVAKNTQYENRQIIETEDDVVGFVILCYPHLNIWQRKVHGHGVATWVQWKTIEMHNMLKLPPQIEGQMERNKIIGYDEDTHEIFLSLNGSVYMVQHKLLQSRKIYESYYSPQIHSFNSFYTPGTSITGGCNGAEMLHDT